MKVINAHPGRVESVAFQIPDRLSFGSVVKSAPASSAVFGSSRAGSSATGQSGSSSKLASGSKPTHQSKKNLAIKENLPSISENPVRLTLVRVSGGVLPHHPTRGRALTAGF
jgi:hypothetical protein